MSKDRLGDMDRDDALRRLCAIDGVLDELDMSGECGVEWMSFDDAVARICIILNRSRPQFSYADNGVPTFGENGKL